MNHEIGVGLIGAGDISLYHAQGIEQCVGTKLVGFYDVLPDRALKQRPLRWPDSQRHRWRLLSNASGCAADPAKR